MIRRPAVGNDFADEGFAAIACLFCRKLYRDYLVVKTG
jgi:hypothetical protein